GGDQGAPRAGGGTRPKWSADGKTVYVTVGEQGMGNLARVDIASGRVEPWTTGKHVLSTFAMEGGTTVALRSTPTTIGDLYLVGGDGALTRLTNVNEKLWSELTFTEPDEMWTTSFDGKRIESWVQKPPDFDPSKKSSGAATSMRRRSASPAEVAAVCSRTGWWGRRTASPRRWRSATSPTGRTSGTPPTSRSSSRRGSAKRRSRIPRISKRARRSRTSSA